MAEQQSLEPAHQPRKGLPHVLESRACIVAAYLAAPAAPYLAFLPMLPLLFPNMRRSAYMHYHAWNALLLTGLVALARGLLNLVALPIALSGANCADALCSVLSLVNYVLLPTAAAVLAMHLAYEAYRRRPARVPVLSDWAERWAATDRD